MRRSTLLLALPLAGLVVAMTAPVSATTTRPAALPAHHATTSVTVRPVTSAGTAASGFHVTKGDGTIDCKNVSPSPGAVDPNIDFCGPSYQYAIACWKSAKAHHALCIRKPSSSHLYQIKLMSSFGSTSVPSAKSRAPLRIKLADGAHCSIRDGGAWGTLKSHPKWAGSYSCDKYGVVWAAPHSNHYGIDESSAAWTVHTASAAGTGKVTVRRVVKVWFVGTAS